MPAPTLVLPPRLTTDSDAIANVALTAGWHVERLVNWRPPAHLRGLDLVLYGEPLFAEVIASALDLALLEAPYDWLVHLPVCYTQRTISFTTLGEARELTEPAFIKPVESKSFPAAVYESGEHLPSAETLPGATPVLVAETVNWEVEFRCFILDRQVMTSSPYWRHDELAQEADGTWQAPAEECEQAQGFITTFLADETIALPPAVVVDVGRIQGRGWAVIEANAAWGSGLYGCNAARALPVLRRACTRREHLAVEDVPWVIEKGMEIEW